ncbi:unnamed protein product [Linum trigynum]|uniref:Uncharacterized protein n=1 Tax=Linum trigynum TaxID=586398 RepID=A0AAV2FV62_9ROSI
MKGTNEGSGVVRGDSGLVRRRSWRRGFGHRGGEMEGGQGEGWRRRKTREEGGKGFWFELDSGRWRRLI